MWDLEKLGYLKVSEFEFPHAFSYGDTREGRKERDKREIIRGAASPQLLVQSQRKGRFAFRIEVVRLEERRRFDVDNAVKLVMDAFSGECIRKDSSSFSGCLLYDDDSIDYVDAVQVVAKRGPSVRTRVELLFKENSDG